MAVIVVVVVVAACGGDLVSGVSLSPCCHREDRTEAGRQASSLLCGAALSPLCRRRRAAGTSVLVSQKPWDNPSDRASDDPRPDL